MELSLYNILPERDLYDLNEISRVIANIATAGAALAALWWFVFTRSFKQRIQFDVDLKVYDIGADKDYVAELMLLLKNKGQREHRLYNLLCEVRQSRIVIGSDKVNTYFTLSNIIPVEMKYFFIAANVKQTFPVTFTIPRTERIVRAWAIFIYEQKRLDLSKLGHFTPEKLDRIGYTPHSVSKLFEVKPSPAA